MRLLLLQYPVFVTPRRQVGSQTWTAIARFLEHATASALDEALADTVAAA